MAIAFPAGLAPRTRRIRTLIASTTADLGRRARSISRIARARVGYAAGVATTSWGVGVQFGLGWALMAGGVAMSVSFLLLYPVDDRP